MTHSIGFRLRGTASTGRALPAVALGLALALGGPESVRAQSSSVLTRIRAMDVEQVDAGRVQVLYSSHPEVVPDAAAAAGAVAERFEDAAAFFAEALGGDFRFRLALLSPRDWRRVAADVHPVPWHSQPDRMVVLPVRPDLEPLVQTGPGGERARRVYDIVGLHQLGHVVASAFFHPGGYREPVPPVRWFDELLASYLAVWYMREHEPELSEYMEDLAWEVVRRVEPRFSSLVQYDEYYDGFLSSPGGSTNLGWYQNAFNLHAARLYDRHGAKFGLRVGQELPWHMLEAWTTESLLEALHPIAPGMAEWAEEMEAETRGRY